MKTTHYQIGDTAYIVRHWPFWPSEEEKAKIEASGYSLHDMAYSKETEEVFAGLTKAIVRARKAAQTSFYGFAEVVEARLTNPYADDIPDALIKRSALTWEETGGYKAEVER